MNNKADIAVIGLAVMGENLILNMANHGFTVACYNRTTSKIDAFTNGRGADKSIIGCHSLPELVSSLRPPRKIMLMVKAGKAVDAIIAQLIPLLNKGDIIIDGGNSHYPDSERRMLEVESEDLLFVGTGVSGGEEGALKGPSIMPGGSPAAWEHIKPIFQAIAAKTRQGEACCDWVGSGGAGHFVKMVHNGIEYGDMQLICEVYHMLKAGMRMTNPEMHEIFSTWNSGELDSYLIEITADILAYKNGNDEYELDNILDSAGQKGTGKWTVINALEIGQPLTLIGEAVFARCLSALKDERDTAARILSNDITEYQGDRAGMIEALRQTLYAAKIISYAQGFQLMRAISVAHNWKLNFGNIALMWRGGCIIRSKFLEKINAAYKSNPDLANLMLDNFFQNAVTTAIPAWRKVITTAVGIGLPLPAISSALAYYDGYRCDRLPTNLLQAQRDYFGAHTYERLDNPHGEFFHTNWTGQGGKTASTPYDV